MRSTLSSLSTLTTRRILGICRQQTPVIPGARRWSVLQSKLPANSLPCHFYCIKLLRSENAYAWHVPGRGLWG